MGHPEGSLHDAAGLAPHLLCYDSKGVLVMDEIYRPGKVRCDLCGYTTSSAHFELHVDHMLLSHQAADHNEAERMAIKHFHVADK
jgi:hypothetical protein